MDEYAGLPKHETFVRLPSQVCAKCGSKYAEADSACSLCRAAWKIAAKFGVVK